MSNAAHIKEAKRLVLVGLAMFMMIAVLFWTAGFVQRTKTLPLYKITLTSLGCTALSQNGIPVIQTTTGCTAEVRFRKNLISQGGLIEHHGHMQMGIGGEQIVAYAELDDGSDQPWTTDHKIAIIALVGVMALFGCFVLWMLKSSIVRPRK